MSTQQTHKPEVSTAIAPDHPYARHKCLHTVPLVEHCQQCYEQARGLWQAKEARGTSPQGER